MSRESEELGVRVITAFEFRRVGDVFFPPAMLRDRLIRMGLVERVSPIEAPRRGLRLTRRA